MCSDGIALESFGNDPPHFEGWRARFRDLALGVERELRLRQGHSTDDGTCIGPQGVAGSLLKNAPEQFGLLGDAQSLRETFHRGGVFVGFVCFLLQVQELVGNEDIHGVLHSLSRIAQPRREKGHLRKIAINQRIDL
jgi:hypothetical protein